MKIILYFFGGFLIGAVIIASAVFFLVVKNIPEQKLPDTKEVSAEEKFFDLRERSEVLVSIFENGFHPRNFIIKKGAKVYWKNEGESRHFPNLPFLEQSPLEVGEAISHVFNERGVYIYQCGIHGETMPAKITVE